MKKKCISMLLAWMLAMLTLIPAYAQDPENGSTHSEEPVVLETELQETEIIAAPETPKDAESPKAEDGKTEEDRNKQPQSGLKQDAAKETGKEDVSEVPNTQTETAETTGIPSDNGNSEEEENGSGKEPEGQNRIDNLPAEVPGNEETGTSLPETADPEEKVPADEAAGKEGENTDSAVSEEKNAGTDSQEPEGKQGTERDQQGETVKTETEEKEEDLEKSESDSDGSGLPKEQDVPELPPEQEISEKSGTEEPGEEEAVSQLSTAMNLKLSSEGLTSILLTFQGDSTPTQYRVYRATAKKGTYKNLGDAWETAKGEYRFEDLTAKRGITYYYKVRAFIVSEEGTQWGTGYSAIVSGKAKPGSVGKVTGQVTNSSTLKISWNKVSYATGYQIGRSTKIDSGYKTLYTGTSGKKVTYTDSKAKIGGQYYYRVRAYYSPADGSKTIYGPYTYSSVILCEPAAPTNFKVVKSTESSVTLGWTPAPRVKYYSIKYTWEENGKTKSESISSIAQSKKKYTINQLSPGQGLTFQIRSYALSAQKDELRSGVAECQVTLPGGTQEPAEGLQAADAESQAEAPGAAGENQVSEITEEEPLLPDEEEEGHLLEKELLETAPVISDYDVTSAGVHLVWQDVPGAVSYRVERSAKQKSGYIVLAQGVADPGFLDTTAVFSNGYYYRVAALDEEGLEMCSEPKGIFAAKAKSLTAKKGSDGYYTFTWTSQKNAVEYRIYRSVDGDAFTKVKTVAAGAARSWKDSTVKAGKTYAYYVQVWKKQDGIKIPGAKGIEKSMYIGVKENPKVTVSQDAAKISLSWEKVTNASGYVIYGAKGDAELKKLGTVGKSLTAWSQTPPAASGYLKYYVRAYAVVGGKRIYAPASEPVSILRLAAPQISLSRGQEQDTVVVQWSGIGLAQRYRVYYKNDSDGDYQYIETDEHKAVIPAEGGQTSQVYVRAVSQEEENLYIGSRSVIKTITPYWKFALLVGNSQYTAQSSLSRLAATAADLAGFSVVLNRANGWKVNARANLTGPEIISAITQLYSEANENSTCLFYYSGHGTQGRNENTGSFCGTDGSYVTLKQLKAALDAVPGKTVVLMDYCGSGAAVENDSGVETLTEEKYSVITAAKAYESSFASKFRSYFTHYLAFGSGYDYDTKKVLKTQPADANQDQIITFQEICSYITRWLTGISVPAKWLPDPEASLY